jgi:hypothetical protein
MSNYLAVATVTAAMGYVLRDVSQAIEGAEVTYERPDRLEFRTVPVELGINLYLYRTRTDPFFRNQDLPTRSPTGDLVQLPTASLSLNYLLTFFGDDSKFEPQRLHGWATTALHMHPVLTPDDIDGAVAAYPALLTGSDLSAQIQRVKLTPIELSLEDLSKIWSVFVASPYLLSVAYEASVVLVNPDELPPPPSLPVLQRNLFVLSSEQPVVSGVTPHWVTPGGAITINGSRFGRSPVTLTISGNTLEVLPESPTRITCTLPSSLAAGVNSLTVATQLDIGTADSPEWRQMGKSNVAAFVVVPSITTLAFHALLPPSIEATVQPTIGTAQRVVLWLTEVVPSGTSPHRYGLNASHLSAPSTSVWFNATGVASGTYLARLYVDDALSVPSGHDQVVIP